MISWIWYISHGSINCLVVFKNCGANVFLVRNWRTAFVLSESQIHIVSTVKSPSSWKKTRQVWKPENPNLPCRLVKPKKTQLKIHHSRSFTKNSIKIRKSFKHAPLHKWRFYMMFYHFCPILPPGLACRYTWSATSPAAKKPGTEVLVPCTWIYPVLKTSRKEPLDRDFLTSMI